MPHIIQKLTDKNLISPPSWLPDNTAMLGMMGSVAYGVSSDTSDVDVYGFCLPPKNMVFPNDIPGFGRQKKRFEQFQQHHIKDGDKTFDFAVFSVVKYFNLCMENNPNCIDSLFIPQSCILHINAVGTMMREKRRRFLHKGIFYKLKGYSYSQLHKAGNKDVVARALKAREFEEKHNIPHFYTIVEYEAYNAWPQKNRPESPFDWLSLNEFSEYGRLLSDGKESDRFYNIKKKGMDSKALYHTVRLLSQCEEILLTEDLNLQEVGRREHMKAVRRGEISEKDIRKWASDKEHELEKLYANSKLPHGPREEEIRQLLLDCLEHHYGSLEKCVSNDNWAENSLREIQEIIRKNNSKLYK